MIEIERYIAERFQTLNTFEEKLNRIKNLATKQEKDISNEDHKQSSDISYLEYNKMILKLQEEYQLDEKTRIEQEDLCYQSVQQDLNGISKVNSDDSNNNQNNNNNDNNSFNMENSEYQFFKRSIAIMKTIDHEYVSPNCSNNKIQKSIAEAYKLFFAKQVQARKYNETKQFYVDNQLNQQEVQCKLLKWLSEISRCIFAQSMKYSLENVFSFILSTQQSCMHNKQPQSVIEVTSSKSNYFRNSQQSLLQNESQQMNCSRMNSHSLNAHSLNTSQEKIHNQNATVIINKLLENRKALPRLFPYLNSCNNNFIDSKDKYKKQNDLFGSNELSQNSLIRRYSSSSSKRNQTPSKESNISNCYNKIDLQSIEIQSKYEFNWQKELLENSHKYGKLISPSKQERHSTDLKYILDLDPIRSCFSLCKRNSYQQQQQQNQDTLKRQMNNMYFSLFNQNAIIKTTIENYYKLSYHQQQHKLSIQQQPQQSQQSQLSSSTKSQLKYHSSNELLLSTSTSTERIKIQKPSSSSYINFSKPPSSGKQQLRQTVRYDSDNHNNNKDLSVNEPISIKQLMMNCRGEEQLLTQVLSSEPNHSEDLITTPNIILRTRRSQQQQFYPLRINNDSSSLDTTRQNLKSSSKKTVFNITCPQLEEISVTKQDDCKTINSHIPQLISISKATQLEIIPNDCIRSNKQSKDREIYRYFSDFKQSQNSSNNDIILMKSQYKIRRKRNSSRRSVNDIDNSIQTNNTNSSRDCNRNTMTSIHNISIPLNMTNALNYKPYSNNTLMIEQIKSNTDASIPLTNGQDYQLKLIKKSKNFLNRQMLLSSRTFQSQTSAAITNINLKKSISPKRNVYLQQI